MSAILSQSNLETSEITESNEVRSNAEHNHNTKAAHTTGGAVNYLPSSFYTQFLSNAAKNRKPSPIRSLFPLESTPGMLSLLAGKPNGSTFPFTSMNFTARSPTWSGEEFSITLDGELLAEGLQYSNMPRKRLSDWMYGLQEYSHGRKLGEGWQITTGVGSQDVIYKAVFAIMNPGDCMLVESPVYAGSLCIFNDLRLELIEVPTDSEGISSSSLRSILENWPSGKPKPKSLYSVPYGCNPTGMTASLQRRKEVLQLAREHNFLILEDDPYYYLYYGSGARPPSYFALELEEPEVGRVIRFDSLSKVLSSGMRIGFASGPDRILKAINEHTEILNLQTPSITQLITYKLLDNWGYDGFQLHTENVSAFYRERRDVFERALTKHLTGLAQWNTPDSGMFFWFKLLLNDDKDDEGDSESAIRTKAFGRGVLALPGTVFLPDERKTGYVRASFSLIDEEDMEEAIIRLRDAILEMRGIAAL